MGTASETLLLLVFMITLALAQYGARVFENDDADLTYDTDLGCSCEEQIKNISSHINDTLMKVATKEDLNNANVLRNKTLQILQDSLATKMEIDNVTNILINKMSNITAESKEILNMVNETPKNVIEKVKEHLDLHKNSITDELSVIKNQTLSNFYSLKETLTSLASKSATNDIKEEISKLTTADIQKNERLLNIINNTADLQTLISSLMTEPEAIKALIINTRIDALDSIQNVSENMQSKFEGLAVKTDVETLKDMLAKVANKSAVDLLQDTVDALKDGIHDYTLHIHENITSIVEQLENNVNESANSTKIHISTETLGLRQQLDGLSIIKFGGLEDKLQSNSEQLVKILHSLSAFEDIKQITELVGNLATKEGINATTNKIYKPIIEVQNNVDELNQHLTQLVNKKDIENITNLVESLAIKESLETLQDKLNSLSKEDTVKNLTHFLSNQMANKEEVQETKAEITTSTSEIKKELSALKGTVDALSTKDSIHNYTQQINEKFTAILELLENNVTGLAQSTKTHISNGTPDFGLEDKFQNNTEDLLKKLVELKQHLTQLINKNDIENITYMVQSLATNESLETLQDKVNSLSKEGTVKNLTHFVSSQIANKEQVSDLKEILHKLQNEQGKQNNIIKELIANVSKSSNCVESPLFTEQIVSLKNKVENTCSNDNMKEELGKMEERLLTHLEERLLTRLEEGVLAHIENITLSMEGRLLTHLENITHSKKNACSSPIPKEHQNCRNKNRCIKKGGTCMKQNACNGTVLEGLCDRRQYAKQGCACCVLQAVTAGTCEDSVFSNSPFQDVCGSTVKHNMCDSDPLFGFHCCSSCVAAYQIPSDGPHRYVNAPRKVDYKAMLNDIQRKMNTKTKVKID